MPSKVVDASALAALAFGEPDAAAVASRLGSDALVAPSLLWYEIAYVCVSKIRAHPAERERILDALRMVGHLGVQVAEVEPVAVVQLAAATGLTAYDAAYLWLARHLRLPLVTLDRRLAEAWQA